MPRNSNPSPSVLLNFSQSNTLEVSHTRISWLKAKITANNEEYAALKAKPFPTRQDISRMKSLNEELIGLLKEKLGKI